MNGNISEKALNKIKEEHIAPEAKWRINLRRASLWLAIGAGFAALSASLSAAIHAISDNDWDLAGKSPAGPAGFIALTLPYFWIALAVVSSSAVFYEFRHTSRGYKYPFMKIAGFLLISSFALGFGLHAFHSGEAIEDFMDQHHGFFPAAAFPKFQAWNRPDDGFLAGRVEEVASSGVFTIIDFSGNSWRIRPEREDIQVKGCARMVPGARLKLVGKKNISGEFEASEVRPWTCRMGPFPAQGAMHEMMPDRP
jgi:hypothetical protein